MDASIFTRFWSYELSLDIILKIEASKNRKKGLKLSFGNNFIRNIKTGELDSNNHYITEFAISLNMV